MKKVIRIIILIVIIGVVWWLLEKQKSLPGEEDEVVSLLENLKQTTEINFSEIQDVEFKWVVNVDPQIKEETVSGKGFEANVIPSEQFDKIHPFLTDNGFETDIYNLAAGTISGLTGYIKNKTVCTVAGGLTGYEEAEGQWIPTDTDNWDITVKCGKVEKTKMEYAVEDWQVYTNEKYGYSLKYPQPCLFGPLPGYCKQSPPEERPQECRCYFNAEDPNSVSLGKFTGTKSDLTGASFVVFHSIYVDHYSPPTGTDLIEWLNEHYSYYEDIPDEINMELDGISAVRIYVPKSPMAWSQEDIYFIKRGKVFQISMLDVDNEDNSALYTKILSTFKFLGCEDQPNLIGLGFKDNREANKVFVEENGKFKSLTGEEWQEQDYKWYCHVQHYVEEDIPGEVLNKFSESNFLAKAKADIEDWETYSNQELGIEFKYPAEWQIKESEAGGKHIESRAPYGDYAPVLGPFVIWVDKSTAGANWGGIDDIKTITIKGKKVLLVTRGSAAPNNKIYYTVRISDESHSFYFKYTPSQQGSLGWTEDYHQSVFATILSTFKFTE